MSIKKLIAKFWDFKNSNENKYRYLKIALLILFPVLIVFISELNHIQSLSAVWDKIVLSPNVFLFSIAVESVVFAAMLFLTKSANLSVFINGIALFIFSCVEYYKFAASGTHFVITDMMMIGNASDMTKFTYIEIMPILVVNLFALLIYNAVIFFLNVKINFKYTKSLALGMCFTFVLTCFIVNPVFSGKVYAMFDIPEEESSNSFIENDKFDNLNFVSFFVESATGLFTYAMDEPDNYEEQAVQEIIRGGNINADANAEENVEYADIDEETEAKSEMEVGTGTEDSGNSGKYGDYGDNKTGDKADNDDKKAEKINVIYILSESFADFRKIDPDDTSLDINYKNFDLMRSEGFGGTCVVPTFGGYTTRSEFEIIFGLPLKSIGTPAMPSNKLKRTDEEKIITIADYYKSRGYSTAYIHPFSRSFYNRDEIYIKYGFDTMIFDDNMTVDIEYYNNKYINDKTVFEQIIDVIKSDEKANYILSTTMQNHVPYAENKDEITGAEEYDFYMQGIRETDKALGYLRDMMLELDEKCVIIFLGDHYPFFVTDDNKYKSLGINSKNCSDVYEQNYFIWANFDFELNMTALNAHDIVSAFYLPNIVAKSQGFELAEDGYSSNVIDAMYSEIDNSPVYTQFYNKNLERNRSLDLLTYDLIVGEKFALE